MLAQLILAKNRQQMLLEKTYPATLTIAGTDYPAALSLESAPMMTLEGGLKQERKAHFVCRTAILPLSVLRDTSAASQPMRRLPIIHKETGLTYRLQEEQTDPHGVIRLLTCTQAEN